MVPKSVTLRSTSLSNKTTNLAGLKKLGWKGWVCSKL